MPLPAAARARTPARLRLRWRRLRRAVLARRRLVAAVLTATAVLAGVRAASAAPETTAPVVVARADLPGGAVLTGDDLTVAHLPRDAVPSGSAAAPGAVTGRLLAAPVRRGEPVTDVRLVTPDLLDGYPGQVAAPVRVADEAAVRLLRVGDRVDLVATDPGRGRAVVVARRAPVVALPATEATAGDVTSGGGLVVVAVTEQTALELAAASVSVVLSLVLTQ